MEAGYKQDSFSRQQVILRNTYAMGVYSKHHEVSSIQFFEQIKIVGEGSNNM